MFFGGSHDREALEQWKKMDDHLAVEMNFVRFLQREIKGDNNVLRHKEKELDEKAVGEFQRVKEGMLKYIEMVCGNIVKEVLAIGKTGYYYEFLFFSVSSFPL